MTSQGLPDPQILTMDGRSIRLVKGAAADGVPGGRASPWPESIHAFRAIWPRLEPLGPLISVDLPDFGRSDARPSKLDP